MWRDIINDKELLHLVAKYWILPIASGYLQQKYRDHLAGGRLVALSKNLKPGIRPINVTDTWRRIAAKGLLLKFLREYEQFFRNSHPRVFQFATATPDGATFMYHLLKCITDDLARSNGFDDDPVVVVPLDLKNAYNEESRQHISNHMAAGCPIKLDSQNNKDWQGWDLLWPIFKAHYGTKGILKYYHAG